MVVEFVRAELPELVNAGERVRGLIGRSSLPFAVLAGIGAERVFGEVLRSLAFVVLETTRPERAPRPYDVAQILGPAIGLVVARRAGGTAGALWYLAYSAAMALSGWIRRALTCASGPAAELGSEFFCDYGPLDLLAGAVPLLIGLGVGALVVRSVSAATRTGANPFLEAAGIYTAVALVLMLAGRVFVYDAASGISPVQVALIVATTVISGMLAGAICARRSMTPIRTAVILIATLLATWLYPLGWSQLLMTAGADWPERPQLLLVAMPLLGAAMILLTARVARKSGRRVGC